MSLITNIQNVGLLVGVFSLLLFFLYRLALPRPIPGIPYNKLAASRILGDLPEALPFKDETGSLFSYFPDLAERLDTPIFQAFMRPFGKPWIILMDPYEAHDIRTRRMADFDRSKFFEEVFGTLLPRMHVHFPTGEEWKAHRRLISDSMNTKFLHEVVAPQMWHSAQNVIKLWQTKARIADGRPWDAEKDIFKGALEIAWAAVFGKGMESTETQHKSLTNWDRPLSLGDDETVVFPTAEDPPAFSSILALSESVEHATSSPFPRWSHWFVLTFFPSLRNATHHKNSMIRQNTRIAYEKYQKRALMDDPAAIKNLDSVVDLIVARESQIAAKEGRAPNVYGDVVRDELFGFMIASHDTSSTFICWALKFLTDNQAIQSTLREALCSHYTGTEGSPSVEDMSAASIPYLDAVIEEIGRCGITAPATVRLTKNDTEILGYQIPKGVDVLMLHNGQGFLRPHVGQVKDSQRTKGSLDQKTKLGAWNDADVGRFSPERWLRTDADGKTYFEQSAGPNVPFGSGPRACFGKKWAQLEIRIILTLIIWHFELQPTPAAVSSHRAVDGVTHKPVQTYVRLKEIAI